ncbi:MAG: DUF4382 domain-containing protein [Candidatus Latescibacteria bacterium]|nr:DUF4382 domain-containing protein [Candidatus Latescibacterota bacterium]
MRFTTRSNTRQRWHVSSLVLLVFLGFLAGCGNPTNSQTGRMRVVMTDDPFPAAYVSSAMVTITKVEARNQSADGSPFVTLSDQTKTYNLLTLQNGITTELANLEVLAGTYDQFRLFVGAASVTLTDGRTFNLTVPSGASSGLKVNISPAIEVSSQLSAELTLDFDLSKSFVAQGNLTTAAGITGFLFKPVIRCTNTSTTGRITGTVRDTSNVALEGVTVSAIQDTVVSTTLTSSTGQYALVALPAGTYTVKAEKTGYITLQQSGASVTAGNATTLNFQMTPQ